MRIIYFESNWIQTLIILSNFEGFGGLWSCRSLAGGLSLIRMCDAVYTIGYDEDVSKNIIKNMKNYSDHKILYFG